MARAPCRAVVVNEMTSPDWDQVQPGGLTLGEEALIARWAGPFIWLWVYGRLCAVAAAAAGAKSAVPPPCERPAASTTPHTRNPPSPSHHLWRSVLAQLVYTP